MSAAREVILATLRAARGEEQAAPVAGPNPGRPSAPDDRVARFVSELERIGVQVHRAADEADAARHVERVAEEVGARDVARSDGELVARVTAGLDTFEGWTDRARLLEAGLGVTGVQAGIAETGTLMLTSSDERHRVTSLVPPVHLALVREGQVVDDLDAAFELAGRDGLPPLVTFVSGPSRTADIELTLIVGVHGPRELHVVLLA